MACQHASRAAQSGGQYIVLLILTDGVIMDMQQTIDSVVAASTLPLSVRKCFAFATGSC